MTITKKQQQATHGDALYEQYGKPLEAEHWGKYVAISEGGQILLANTLPEAMQGADRVLGPGNYIFQVGTRVVGRWRTSSPKPGRPTIADALMGVEHREVVARADALYERYGKPLEAEHWGEFIAISEQGEFVLGATAREAMDRANAAFGRGGFLFKVGEISVGRWR